MRLPAHIIGFDDAPFNRNHRGDVSVVGAIFTGTRLDGVVCGKVRRDGANATTRLAGLIAASRFRHHLQLIMLQGIALAGFNVVDIQQLHRVTGLPVLVISRKQPNLAAIAQALNKVPGGRRKWQRLARAGAPEALAGVWVQRAGIDSTAATQVILRTALHSAIPEPLRTAHIIAGGITAIQSKHRV
nr:hypothetical conserved protein [uncultured Gammaproteobacteria bacterium]